MKKIILLLLLTTAILFGGAKFHDLRLLHYPQARPWLQDADTNGASANNIAVLYSDTIKDNEKAIKWFNKAYELSSGQAKGEVANNLASLYDDLKKYNEAEKWYKKGISDNYTQSSFELGLLYKKLHRYNDAIFYYKKAYNLGDLETANSLGLLYEQNLKKYDEAKLWYTKAAKEGYSKSYKNLALLNRDQGQKIEGAGWYIALIDQKYPKEKVLNYLKTKWKLTDKEIKKAYQLQKNLDIPKHYYDKDLEDTPPKKKTGRR